MSWLSSVIYSVFFIFAGAYRPTAEVRIISFSDFEAMMSAQSDQLRVYNFWATWCGPCVKEMPYFEKVANENSGVELVFISLDDGRKPERVDAFIQKRGIGSPVYLLDDVNYNEWIDKVATSWSGAIPATLFISSDGVRHFHEGEIEEHELNELITQLKQIQP